MGDTPQQDKKSYKLNEFKPQSAEGGKTAVLGQEGGMVGTELGVIPWETYGKDLETLVRYRDTIDPESVRTMARNWGDHGKKLSSLAAEFSNQVKTKIIDSWDSDGGRLAASPAVQRYADQLVSMSNVVKAVANSLNYSAGYLETTKKNIPDANGKLTDGKSIVESDGDYDTPETQAHLKRLLTDRANDVMNQVFVPGGKSADATMPVFTLPAAVTGDLPDPTKDPTKQQTPTGGPKLGGPGPASPSTNPALKQQQEALAAQRKAIEEAQKRAEEEAKKRAAEIAKQTAEAERQAAQRAAQQQAQQAQQAAQEGVQQALQAAQQAAEQGLSAAQQAAQEGLQAASMAGMPASLAGLGQELGKGLAKGAGPGPAPKTGALSSGAALAKDAASKLFPRATVGTTAATAAMAGRGLAAAAGTPGMPGATGASGAGGQQGGQNDKHKRPSYLDSTEHLDEAFGDAPVASKPVAD
ncbi:cell envelope integrity protein TolA [Nocardia sp. NPDC127579]|uniref:cell envelope integrity protein TolA n=1 Tax=Nocardia sp. NPDC127579 TaxID=3345402 RepID=UPI0036346E33